MLSVEMRPQRLLVWFLRGAIFVFLGLCLTQLESTQAAPQVGIVGEGVDYATLNLESSWDMDSFYDISQWINHAGDSNLMTNIQVSDGVFSARATGDYSEFYLLFPGYEPGMHEPNFGIYHPIDSNEYSCVYLTMKVDVDTSRDYYFNLGWVEDDTVDWGNSAWGRTYGNKIVPNQWVTYHIPLKTWPWQDRDHWTSLPEWQGFRVTPIFGQPNTTFAVDWVRLTNCEPVYYPINGLSPGTYSLWLDTGVPDRQIRYIESFSPNTSGQYNLDVQGVQPGQYHLYAKNQANQTIQLGQLTIDPAPLPEFTNPSPYTGVDYSTLAGNPWDMDSAADIDRTYCINWVTQAGLLQLETLSPSLLPADCKGSIPEADPVIYLNTPLSVNISEYRYLSFRHWINGDWSVPEKGMAVRWLWRVEHPTVPNGYCEYVSREIMLDVGLKTYWVDLYDPWNGAAVQVGSSGQPGCDLNIHWAEQTNPVLYFRFDPNENTLATSMYQTIDWIRLTKVPTVQRGNLFPIQVSLSESPDLLTSIDFYYTSNLGNPTQRTVRVAATHGQQTWVETGASGAAPLAGHQVFLPLVLKNYAAPHRPPEVENEVLRWWDTSAVSPGTYYLCAVSNDGYNQTTLCSDAPVQVLP